MRSSWEKTNYFKRSYILTKKISENYNKLPRKVTKKISENHNNWDFIGSNMPGLSKSIPSVKMSNIIREKRGNWTPSIYYGTGLDTNYSLDIYWYVSNNFDKNNFKKTLIEYFNPKVISEDLPISY